MSNSFATPWTVAHQAPLPMEFSRQEYWSGLPFPFPGDLSDLGIELASAALAGKCSLPQRHLERAPFCCYLTGSQASPIAQLVKNPPAMQETAVQSWVRKIPWRRKWQPTSVFMPGKSHELRSLAGYSPWGHKELDITEWAHTHIAG